MLGEVATPNMSSSTMSSHRRPLIATTLTQPLLEQALQQVPQAGQLAQEAPQSLLLLLSASHFLLQLQEKAEKLLILVF